MLCSMAFHSQTDADAAGGGRADVWRAQFHAPVFSEPGSGAVNDVRLWRDGAGAIPFGAYLFQVVQLLRHGTEVGDRKIGVGMRVEDR